MYITEESNNLKHIKIEGFKSIAKLDLPMKNINILIGANGAGKTNMISLFTFLSHLSQGKLRYYVAIEGGAERFFHFDAANIGPDKGGIFIVEEGSHGKITGEIVLLGGTLIFDRSIVVNTITIEGNSSIYVEKDQNLTIESDFILPSEYLVSMVGEGTITWLKKFEIDGTLLPQQITLDLSNTHLILGNHFDATQAKLITTSTTELSLLADVEFLSNQEIAIGSLHLNGYQLYLHQISSLQEESGASEAYTPRLILFNPLVMNHAAELIDAGLAELVFLEEVILEAGKIQSSGGVIKFKKKVFLNGGILDIQQSLLMGEVAGTQLEGLIEDSSSLRTELLKLLDAENIVRCIVDPTFSSENFTCPDQNTLGYQRLDIDRNGSVELKDAEKLSLCIQNPNESIGSLVCLYL